MNALPAASALDVMRTDVLSLNPNATMGEAVTTLAEYGVHGAPVVDAVGALVGVLTLTDVVRRDSVREENEQNEARGWASLAGLDDEFVRDWMTDKVTTVGQQADLKDLCGLMSKEQIHRVFVVDQGRLTGVVSALDVVGFLAENSNLQRVSE